MPENQRKTCIVHIGMHKTGSSSIQNFLFNHLTDQQFAYADAKAANQSQVIYSLFSKNPEKYHTNKAAGMTVEDVSKFNDENRKLLDNCFQNAKADTIIISAEDIMYLKPDELKNFRNYLQHYFSHIEIIGYVRPLMSYIVSAFQELVKHGLKRLDFTYADPDYKRFLAFYRVFGEENVHIRPFIKEELIEENVLADFCHQLKMQNEFIPVKEDNQSLSKEAVSIIYAYQKFTKDFYRPGPKYMSQRAKLIKTLSSIGTSKLQFSQKIVSNVLKNNQVPAQSMEKILGVSLLEEEASDSGDIIGTEADLLRFSDTTINNLVTLLNNNGITDVQPINSAEDVAKLVNQLNIKINHLEK